MRRFLVIGLLIALAAAAGPAAAQEGQRYAVLIGGLGGSPAYTETFRGYLFETRQALVDRLGFAAANVTVLAEPALGDQPFVDDVSTAEVIQARFGRLAGRVQPRDQVFVILFGHGSYDGTHARLNIPRRDLDDADYAALLDALRAGRTVFVNTASASAPFIEALSASNRIVITATRRGTQRNETLFPRFFVEALTSPSADLDKNGDLSVAEVFRYAAEQTARSYETGGLLATEHALLEDTGDAEGHRIEDLEARGEGNLAAVTYLRRGGGVLAGTSAADRAVLGPLLQERDALERDIAALKSRKQALNEGAYYARLETLFVRLARLNDRIEGQGQ